MPRDYARHKKRRSVKKETRESKEKKKKRVKSGYDLNESKAGMISTSRKRVWSQKKEGRVTCEDPEVEKLLKAKMIKTIEIMQRK